MDPDPQSRQTRLSPTGAVVGTVALLAAVLVGIVGPVDGAAADCPVYRGSPVGTAYTVPAAGVTQVFLEVNGQPGEGWHRDYPGNHTTPAYTIDVKGGLGSTVHTTLTVTPGQVLQAWRLAGAAGGYGGADPKDNPRPAPSPPGGDGGDAQYITVTAPGSGACAELLILAAGGGGAGAGTSFEDTEPGNPGFGGNADAGSGATRGGDADDNDAVDGGGGGPASATGGGYGGAHGHSPGICSNGNDGQAGGFMSGGLGGLGHGGSSLSSCDAGWGGGGGGAGYYYGGGGGTGYDTEPSGGAGGGSSYVKPGLNALQGPLPVEMAVDDPAMIPVIDTATVLSSSPNPSTLGQPVTFTAVVTTPVPSVQISGGSVTFRNGNSQVSDVAVVPNADGSATATFVTSSLPAGTLHLSATYNGFSGGGTVLRPTVGAKLDQGVGPKTTFTSTAPANAQANGATYGVTATNSAGLDVHFSIDATSSAVCTISGATVTFVAAGTCRIHAHQYSTPTVPFESDAVQDVTVAGAIVQTITFNSTPPVGAMPGDSYTVSATGGASGNPVTFSTSSADPCMYTGTATNAVQLQAGGTCRIFAHQNGGNGFAAADAQQVVTIGAVPDTIIFDSTAPAEAVPGDTYLAVARTGAFNLATFSLAANSTGCTKAADGAYGQYQASAQITFTGVGTCIIVASTTGNPPRLSGAQGQQTVAVKAPQKITVAAAADQPNPTYGGSYGFSPTGGGSGNPVTLTTLTPTSCTVSSSTVTFLAAGFCQIRFNQAGNAQYAAAPAEYSNIGVSLAPLTITPPDATLAYGASVPASFTPVITGLVAGDTLASFDPPITCSAAGPVAGVGTYPISCGYVYHPGYRVTATANTLTITRAPVTVAAPTETVAYGTSVPASFAPEYSGFAPGESASSLTTPATCAPTTTVAGAGSYPVACSGAASPNYTFTYTTGTLTITQGVVTVAAPSESFVYGASVPATFPPAYSGFVPGESASSLDAPATCGPTTTVGGVGQYPVACSGAASPNYTFTYTTGTLAVTPAELTVTGPTESFVYGESVPATFPPAYTGFVAGDSPSTLLTPATCGPTTPPAGVGTYALACTGAVNSNYHVTYVDGSLAIRAADVTVTAPTRSVAYGTAASSVSLVPSVDGLVNGETLSAAGLATVTCATTAVATPGGSYPAESFPVTCTGPATTANYAVTYVPATLTVTPAPLTVTASSTTSTYGQAPATTEASSSGWTNGDTPAALTTAPSCGSAASASSPVGTYPTTCAGAVAPNYQIGYVDGVGTVTPAPLLVTADPQSKTYGQPNPTFTVTYDHLVNGDTPASLAGTLTFATPAGPASAVGSYVVTPSGLSSPNYTIGYAAGTLAVTRAAPGIVLSTSLTPAVYGQAGTLTATVAPTPGGAGIATGTVTFNTGSLRIGSVPVVGGTARLPVTFGIVATHTLTAVYSGDANVTGGTSAGLTQVITPAPTLLVASPVGRFLPTFSATLTRAFDGTPLAGQSVVFSVNGKVICANVTDGYGRASCRTPFGSFAWYLPSYSATYNGTGTYLPTTAPGAFR